MSYFNHAFRKTLVATSPSGAISPLNGVQLGTPAAGNLAAGQITFINPNDFLVTPSITNLSGCCEVIIAAGSLQQKDKIGQFHGGYLESNKTKTIKAKYVNKLWAIGANTVQNYTLNVGTTPYNLAVPPVSSDPGDTAGNCCKQFLCGETYYLRVDVKGSPALRLLDHNSYLTLEAYTGCCADDAIAPNPVDPAKVYIQWAQQLRRSKLMNQFVFPIVTQRSAGGAWTYYYPDDITPLPAIANVTVLKYSQYVDNGYQATECAGMVLIGAYEETKFGTCTFQVTDFYEVEPIRIYASEVDLTGSPCEFNGLCVGVQCYGKQANGLGETVVRDVILSEQYRQNFMHTDFRIREITQGYDLYTNAGLSRTSYYDRIFIQHSVPRFYNPTGTFDNDQYIVEIILPANPALNGTLNTNTANLLANIQFWIEQQCGGRCVVESVGATGTCPTSSPAVPLPAVPYPVGL